MGIIAISYNNNKAGLAINVSLQVHTFDMDNEIYMIVVAVLLTAMIALSINLFWLTSKLLQLEKKA